MPWTPSSTHRDAARHQGYAVTIAEDDQRTTDEGVPGKTRQAECSCGWVGKAIEAPRGGAPDKAARSLLVRRQRRQDREQLQPQWDAHVSQWVPDELPWRDVRPASSDPASLATHRYTANEESVEEAGPAEAIEESRREEEPGGEPGEEESVRETGAEDPARALYLRAREAAEADRRAHEAGKKLTTAVQAARAAGLSWTKVAAATGMSKQAAWERWRSEPAQLR